MSIATWLAKIIPSFGNKDLKEKIRLISSKNSDVLRPTLDQFLSTFKATAFASAFGKRVEQLYKTRMFQRDVELFTQLFNVSQNVEKLTDLLEDYSKKHFTNQINVEALTYQQAAALRLIDILDFVVDYSVRLLDHTTACEVNLVAFGNPDGHTGTKAELRFLEENMNGYFDALKILSGDPKKIISDIESIPTVLVINTDISTVPGLQGAHDPLKLDAIPVVSKVFYWFAVRKVDSDIQRYERLKKMRRNVEYRIEALRSQRSGEEPNARVQSIITKYEQEVVVLSDKITRLEA